MNKQLRVWCKDHNEWGRDCYFLSQDGLVYQLSKTTGRLLCIRPENHVVQFCTGLLDRNGMAIYDGDIVEYLPPALGAMNYPHGKGNEAQIIFINDNERTFGWRKTSL